MAAGGDAARSAINIFDARSGISDEEALIAGETVDHWRFLSAHEAL
jgi:hypothetical protein